MDVGKGCTISDQWIPHGLATGIVDIEGNEIKTRDKIQLNGCTSRYAIVGKDSREKFMIFFGSDNGSVGWNLSQETVYRNSIKIVNN